MQVVDMGLNDVLNNQEQRTVASTLPPAEDPNPDETVSFFANELNKLSLKERDEMLQDVHGVSDVSNEDPTFVAQSLENLEVELNQIPVEEKIAYLKALEQNPKYVKDKEFLLMFLRADNFVVKNSALRLSSFFQAKLELFGPDKLGRDITLDDLNEDDLACLESGYCMVLPGRDRAGRAIFFLLPSIRKFKCIENKLRSIYIVVMNGLRDIETQKRGWVGIAYNVGENHSKDREAVWKNSKLLSFLPMSFKGIHYCFDNERVKMLFALAMFVFEKKTRIRVRQQFGTHMECIYNLMTFGIPADILPILPSGDLRLEGHQELIRRLRKHEDLNDGKSRVVLPWTGDVLLGRGKPLQKHPGNLRYHHIIETYQEKYENSMKLEKTNISKDIVQKMKDSGGRFLKQDEAGWVEIDDDAARYKVSHTFRNHRIAQRASERKKMEETLADHRRKFDDSGDSSDGGQFSIATELPLEQKRRRLSDASRGTEASFGFSQIRLV